MTREEYLNRLLSIDINISKADQTATASKYPQGYFKEKPCKVCGNIFIPKAPSELTCSDRCRVYSYIEAYYLRNYKITIEQYLSIAEAQNFTCAICGKENFPMGINHTGLLVVDHDHKTGQIRGLLCHNCNRALGLFQDSLHILFNATTYLEGATTISKESRG